jgi:hypothetical protein
MNQGVLKISFCFLGAMSRCKKVSVVHLKTPAILEYFPAKDSSPQTTSSESPTHPNPSEEVKELIGMILVGNCHGWRGPEGPLWNASPWLGARVNRASFSSLKTQGLNPARREIVHRAGMRRTALR